MDAINLANINIQVTLSPDDAAKLLRDGTPLPAFWHGHPYPPAVGDVLRIGQYRCAVLAREWSHNGQRPCLSLLTSPLVDAPPAPSVQ